MEQKSVLAAEEDEEHAAEEDEQHNQVYVYMT